MRRRRFAAIAVASLVLVTAACSSDKKKDTSAATAAGSYSDAASAAPLAGSSSAAAAASSAASSAPAAAESASAAGGDGRNVAPGPGGEPATKAGSIVVRGRVITGHEDIIKNAAISIESADVDKAVNDAAVRADGLGATVSSAARAGTGKNKSATLLFRVLPTDFDNLVTQLSALGDVVSSKITTEDVTGQVADVEGRIRAAKDSAEKIRALIARAEKISDLVMLEREYAARDADIQSMASQVSSLKDRAGHSSVSLSIGPLTEKPKPIEKPKPREKGFAAGLRSGWDAFTATTVVLATTLGALLPFLIVVAIGLLGWWIARRRRPAKVKPTLDPATPFGTPTL